MGRAEFTDEPHVDRIGEALWAGEPVGSAALLVGAGFSRNATPIRPLAGVMPGWNDIYLTMVDQLYPAPLASGDMANGSADPRAWLIRQTGATSAYLRVAEEFEAQYGRDGLDKLIMAHVPDKQFEPGKLHQMLVELPWADIMTTNWDTLLERAADRAEERVYSVLRTAEEISEARAPRIVKLHGSFPSHRPFIFTEEDFRTYPIRFAPFVNLAQQLSMENTLVLLGFSGDDPNFLFWSGWVRDRLGPKAPLIYLVGALGLSAPKRKMLESRRIQPIDLARLPQFDEWPEASRIATAHQWFLERLSAARPYPTRRWPRVAPAFDPPLTLITPRPDPRAPVADARPPQQVSAVEKLRAHVTAWTQQRLTFPEWVIAPLDTADLIWNGISHHFDEFLPGLPEVDEVERLAALFELNWRLEQALVPLTLTVDDHIIALLDGMVARYDQLSASQASQFRALVLAIVRHAREENDPVLFARWADWLAPRVVGEAEVRERFTYERCMHLRANIEIDALEQLVAAWKVEGDSFWLVRKAGLLVELGREEEASHLSGEALATIRGQTRRGSVDIASWSRETFAMLFRSFALYGAESWAETKGARDRFDLRQEELQAKGCPGRRDFFELAEQLSQPPPPFKKLIEQNRRFDVGATTVTTNFGPLDPRTDRLRAYQALRFQEEAGLPLRLGYANIGGQLLSGSARWLMDVAPTRAIDALFRTASHITDKTLDQILSRATVAHIAAEEADRLVDRMIGLIVVAHARVEARGPDAAYWLDRVKATLEIVSRLILRAPKRAPQVLKIALELHAEPRLARRFAAGDELRRLITRTIEAADASDREEMMLEVFRQPIVTADGDKNDEWTDAAAGLSKDYRPPVRSPEWGEVASQTLGAAGDVATRATAVSRLGWLFDAKLLDQDDLKRLGAVLWEPTLLVDGLPGTTNFYPSAFLQLPHPPQVDAQEAYVRAAQLDQPLTDQRVIAGEATSLLARRHIALSAKQLLVLLEHFRAFVTGHPPEPAHPEFLGDDRGQLVSNTARMFAELAARAAPLADASEIVREIAALERYPLYIEPAVPALVGGGLMGVDEALVRVNALLDTTGSFAAARVRGFFRQMEACRDIPPAFEAAVWRAVGLTIAARRPDHIIQALAFTLHVINDDPDRVPLDINDALDAGLELILSETAMASPAENLAYDAFFVRFFAAGLVTAMALRGRGSAALHDAWAKAIDADPLPETRRARDLSVLAFEQDISPKNP